MVEETYYALNVALMIYAHYINGGGGNHRKINLVQGGKIYAWLKAKDYPKGFQTLCMNCQWIKRDENNEHKGINHEWCE
jgi:hypothetical protein